jgi:16S rRNA (cytosine1402-N4)-methyltransferase
MTWTFPLFAPVFRFGRGPTWQEELLAEEFEAENSSELSHAPVMVEEVLEALRLGPGKTAVDGTLGLGGHTRRFIEAVSPEGVVLGLDWDESMLAIARERMPDSGSVKVITRHADFRSLATVVEQEGVMPYGILMDLGLNSAQVDDAARGMSFLADGPLDMRMDRTKGEPAAALLNRLAPHEIENVLFEFGDERWARAIAKVIVERRRRTPLRTTRDLVESVLDAVPPRARETRIHPATRTFQAVRIAVNRELEGLREAMLDAANVLAPGGTLVVLTYHSGEDRIVKNAFRTLAEGGFSEVYRKPLVPTATEVAQNRRSRSAKLRAIRRLG